MISVQLRTTILNLLWEGGYQPLAAGLPVQQSTLDAIQKAVRHEPLETDPPAPPVLPWRFVSPVYAPGDNLVFQVSAEQICVVKIQLPPGPYTEPTMLANAAEYAGSGTSLFIASISATPGDMTGATIGAEAGVFRDMTDLAGQVCYYNIRVADGHPPNQVRFSVANYPH